MQQTRELIETLQNKIDGLAGEVLAHGIECTRDYLKDLHDLTKLCNELCHCVRFHHTYGDCDDDEPWLMHPHHEYHKKREHKYHDDMMVKAKAMTA